MKKAKRKAAANRLAPRAPKAKRAPKPRQTRIPGMEDNAILDLEEAAVEHSDLLGEIRERRDSIKKVDERIATLMKREGKTTYNRGGISLKLREGETSVSVKVKRHDREDAEETEEAEDGAAES